MVVVALSEEMTLNALLTFRLCGMCTSRENHLHSIRSNVIFHEFPSFSFVNYSQLLRQARPHSIELGRVTEGFKKISHCKHFIQIRSGVGR